MKRPIFFSVVFALLFMVQAIICMQFITSNPIEKYNSMSIGSIKKLIEQEDPAAKTLKAIVDGSASFYAIAQRSNAQLDLFDTFTPE
jgi:hypothetical protein